MLWMYRRVMFGPVEVAENRSLIDLDLREKLVMVALIIPIIWIGVYPNALLRRIEPSVIELLRVVDVRRTPPSAAARGRERGGARGPAGHRALGAGAAVIPPRFSTSPCSRRSASSPRAPCWCCSARCCSRGARPSSGGAPRATWIGSLLALVSIVSLLLACYVAWASLPRRAQRRSSIRATRSSSSTASRR